MKSFEKEIQAAQVVSEMSFAKAVLKDGSLYLGNSRHPFMEGVKAITTGKTNKIEMLDGRVFEYTPDWKTLLSFAGQHMATVGGYRISSEVDLEVDTDFELVKGQSLTIEDSKGAVLHRDVRGFMHLSEFYYLIRYISGGWMLCANGRALRGSTLRKTNLSLRAKHKSIMFDERGKMHLNVHNPYYSDNLYYD